MTATLVDEKCSPFGRILRHWRKRRGYSQMTLSLETGISTRHLSFIETGRSQPGRETVLNLAETLGLTLRERNNLLIAAGYRDHYSAHSLQDPEMEPVCQALDCMLHSHEPFPSVVFQGAGHVLKANRAARHLFTFLGGEEIFERFSNGYLMFLSPDGLKPYIENWDEMIVAALPRVREEILAGGEEEGMAFLEHLTQGLDLDDAPPENLHHHPVFPLRFRKDDVVLSVTSVVTTFGTPFDVTVQELRLESFFPTNPETRIWFEEAARRDS